MTESLLRRFKLATNAFDQEIADIVGMKRSTVQAVICGRTPEYLDDAQKAKLLAAMRSFVSDATEALETLELLA